MKRQAKFDEAVRQLQARGLKLEMKSESHLRCGDYDLWPTTGTWMHRKTREKGRGLESFFKRLSGRFVAQESNSKTKDKAYWDKFFGPKPQQRSQMKITGMVTRRRQGKA